MLEVIFGLLVGAAAAQTPALDEALERIATNREAAAITLDAPTHFDGLSPREICELFLLEQSRAPASYRRSFASMRERTVHLVFDMSNPLGAPIRGTAECGIRLDPLSSFPLYRLHIDGSDIENRALQRITTDIIIRGGWRVVYEDHLAAQAHYFRR